MEVEHEGINCSKRLKLNRLVQASFGSPEDPDYVFDIATSSDNTIMAVSLSINTIKLYSPGTGQFLGDCVGHNSTINDLMFPDPATTHLFSSCSSDGTIRFWDARNRQQVGLLRSHLSSEIFSVSLGGSNNNLVAGGGKSKVLFWDWRMKKELACLEECHTEDITQVRFHPLKKEKIVTASVDGLMCVLTTLGEINDDDGLEKVMSVGTSVGRLGFYGPSYERLWCLTHIETLSIWDFEEGTNLVDFSNTRNKASVNWTLPPVDYLVQCHYCPGADSLWLVAGNNSGSLGFFPLSFSSNQLNSSGTVVMLGPANAVLEGGHDSIVRTVWSPTDRSNAFPGLFCWTGGEDGRLCSWSEGDQDTDRSSGWVSKSLVKRNSNRKKRRNKPY